MRQTAVSAPFPLEIMFLDPATYSFAARAGVDLRAPALDDDGDCIDAAWHALVHDEPRRNFPRAPCVHACVICVETVGAH